MRAECLLLTAQKNLGIDEAVVQDWDTERFLLMRCCSGVPNLERHGAKKQWCSHSHPPAPAGPNPNG
jgi:hypothetical protein